MFIYIINIYSVISFCPDALRKYLQPQQQPVKDATEESEEASVSMPSAQVEDPGEFNRSYYESTTAISSKRG